MVKHKKDSRIETINFRVSPSNKKKIKAHAKISNISPAQLINYAVLRFIGEDKEASKVLEKTITRRVK